MLKSIVEDEVTRDDLLRFGYQAELVDRILGLVKRSEYEESDRAHLDSSSQNVHRVSAGLCRSPDAELSWVSERWRQNVEVMDAWPMTST